jgi:integrase/recombinase XerD
VNTREVHTLPALIDEHCAWLAATNYAAATIRSRRSSLAVFARWAAERGITHPRQLTLAVLERYQQALAQRRRPDGGRMSWGTQSDALVALKLFLTWCTRAHLVRVNPARELQLPRRPQRLPRTVLSVAEVEQVLAQPVLTDPLGLRDRAMLETLYSTGVRRLELLTLTLPDVDPDRGVVLVREGKGQKDRVVPIGQRALAWIDQYLREVRPLLVVPPDVGILFLTRRGRRLRPNRVTELVHRYVAAAGVGKQGSCHLFRHTMATLLLEGGADIRHIQAMLGHAELSTTARYTRVAIAHLKAVHARTHPAERGATPANDVRLSSLAASLPADELDE